MRPARREGAGGLRSPGALFEQHISASNFQLALKRLRRFPPYDPARYTRFCEDVLRLGIDKDSHALAYGLIEGRSVLDPRVTAQMLADGRADFDLGPANPGGIPINLPKVGIYVSSLGNAFMLDLAHGLASDLASIGVEVVLGDQDDPPPSRPECSIVVAPHEFFLLGNGERWVEQEAYATCFMYSTEQVQTSWFAKSLPYMLASRGVIDLNRQSACLLAWSGVPVMHFEPGLQPELLATERELQHPLIQVLGPNVQKPVDPRDDLFGRAINMTFAGTESPRRERFFARNAAFFADYSCFIYYRRHASGPLTTRPGRADLSRIGSHVAGHSKVMLNLHQSDFAYFEWQRIVQQGMRSGAVVVSEPCLPHSVFKPGVHFLEEVPRQMPNLLDWLLQTKEGRSRALEIRQNAFAALQEECKPEEGASRLVAFLLQIISKEARGAAQ